MQYWDFRMLWFLCSLHFFMKGLLVFSIQSPCWYTGMLIPSTEGLISVGKTFWNGWLRNGWLRGESWISTCIKNSPPVWETPCVPKDAAQSSPHFLGSPPGVSFIAEFHFSLCDVSPNVLLFSSGLCSCRTQGVSGGRRGRWSLYPWLEMRKEEVSSSECPQNTTHKSSVEGGAGSSVL